MYKLITSCALVMASASPYAQAEWVERDYSDFNTHHNEVVEIVYTDLSAHNFVKINFDLFILNSWDGTTSQPNDPTRGNDYWGLYIGDERGEISSTSYTFTNFGGFTSETNPDRSWDYYAAGDNYEGLNNMYGLRIFENYNDGFVFNHTSDTLVLRFYDAGLYGADESWIVDNLFVATSDNSIELDAIGNLQDVPVSHVGLLSLTLLGASRLFRRKNPLLKLQNR